MFDLGRKQYRNESKKPRNHKNSTTTKRVTSKGTNTKGTAPEPQTNHKRKALDSKPRRKRISSTKHLNILLWLKWLHEIINVQQMAFPTYVMYLLKFENNTK